jgi:hypothetical protein
MKENSVNNPKPRPVLPKICCSNGESLAITTRINWTSIKILNTNKIFKVLLLIKDFALITTIGKRYIAAPNSKITFGITSESTFSQGVRTNVTETLVKIIKK